MQKDIAIPDSVEKSIGDVVLRVQSALSVVSKNVSAINDNLHLLKNKTQEDANFLKVFVQA